MMPSARITQRRSSVYIAVLGTALLIAVITSAALVALTLRQRDTFAAMRQTQTRIAARSVIELGINMVVRNNDWRKHLTSGEWFTARDFDGVQVTLTGVDADGDFTDNDRDPVVLTATAICDQAKYGLTVDMAARTDPIEALSSGMHAAGGIRVNSSSGIALSGGPLSCNGKLQNDGAVAGDAEAGAYTGNGGCSGTITTPIDARPVPASSILAPYIARATSLGSISTIEERVLTPTQNPFGNTNDDGIYYVNTGGANLRIRNSRIEGTLIVELGGGTLTLDEYVSMAPAARNMPALLVVGNTTMQTRSGTFYFSPNYQTPSRGYATNILLQILSLPFTVAYESKVSGLVYVSGNLTTGNYPVLNGSVLVTGNIDLKGVVTMTHDDTIVQAPPEGFTQVQMQVATGTWRRVAFAARVFDPNALAEPVAPADANDVIVLPIDPNGIIVKPDADDGNVDVIKN